MMKLRFKATSPMKRNLPGSWKQLKDIPIPRPSNSARSNGITTPKKKLRGNAKMIFEKTTHTFLLTNRNLEDEIHLKGVRSVTSQFSKPFICIAYHKHHVTLAFDHFQNPKVCPENFFAKMLLFDFGL